MESLEHNCGNISTTICTNMLIFSKDIFLVLISGRISTNPISSQILVFVTSHVTTLYKATENRLKRYALTNDGTVANQNKTSSGRKTTCFACKFDF